jgi:hypothetical protein
MAFGWLVQHPTQNSWEKFHPHRPTGRATAPGIFDSRSRRLRLRSSLPSEEDGMPPKLPIFVFSTLAGWGVLDESDGELCAAIYF